MPHFLRITSQLTVHYYELKSIFSVNNYAPEFTQDIYEVKVRTLESDGGIIFQPEVIDKDEIETCKSNGNCPCAEHYFSIQKGNEEALFTIDPNDGSITLNKGSTLTDGKDYMIEITVRDKSGNENGASGKAVVVFKADLYGWSIDPVNSLEEQENNGYSHHIVKRAAVST